MRKSNMSKAPIKTDNSYLATKVKLRMDNLPAKKILRVLDCFHGKGTIWRHINNRSTKKNIIVLGIDKNKDYAGQALIGDNTKFLANMDLREFDIIDLDAYGVPFAQLKIISENPTSAGCQVFVTFIQSGYRGLPKKMLNKLGFPNKMIEKVPSLFYNNGIEKWLQYLAMCGIARVKLYSDNSNRKHYMAFSMPGKGRSK